MKKIDKIVFLFALVAFSGLSAEEEQMDREISMSKVEEGCPRPEDCSGSPLEIEYYRHDPNDAEYDVYTQGSNEDRCDTQERCRPSSCAKSGKCCRKGAAKSAQE